MMGSSSLPTFADLQQLSDMLVDEYETYNNERQEAHEFAADDLVGDTGKPLMADDSR